MTGLYVKLTTDQAAGSFYDDLTGRIYRTQGPDDASFPLCVFFVVSDTPPRFFGSREDIEADIQIDLLGVKGTSETALQATQNKLLTLLDNAALTITGFVGGTIQCNDRGSVDIEDQRPRITSLWTLTAGQ